MSFIYKYGILGGLGGVVVGGFLGGVPGAVALGQLGVNVGLKVGTWSFGGNIVNRLLDESIRVIRVTEKFFLAGGCATGVYWIAGQNLQKDCVSQPDSSTCVAYKWVNVGLATYGAIAGAYVAYKAISRLNDSPKGPETYRGTARIEYEQPAGSQHRSTIPTFRGSLHKSMDASLDSSESLFSSLGLKSN